MSFRFECTQCGHCCRGDGLVLVTEEDIEAIQAVLPIPRDELVVECEMGTSLRTIRDASEMRCVLLGADNRCRAYEARPAQCRAFPFWPRYVASQREWDALAAHCEGIGRGPEIDPDTARATAARLSMRLKGQEFEATVADNSPLPAAPS